MLQATDPVLQATMHTRMCMHLLVHAPTMHGPQVTDGLVTRLDSRRLAKSNDDLHLKSAALLTANQALHSLINPRPNHHPHPNPNPYPYPHPHPHPNPNPDPDPDPNPNPNPHQV